ncbi:MAG: hypothetical protein IJZ56_02345 [Oscillospiraceae bacterium]|nr:hypothetical protein [Oscillospiraceae bacterium]
MINKRIHQVYSIALSVVTVIAGICLMAACVGIYNSGDRPYSPEAVKAAFSSIAIPVYICLVLVIGGFILDSFFPAPKAKNIPPKQYEALLEKQYCKNPALRNNRERSKRQLHNYIALGLLIIGSAVFLFYGTNGANFDSTDITGSMIKAMYVLLPCMAVPFFYAVFAAYYAKKSIKRELEILKTAEAVTDTTPDAPKKAVRCPLMAIRWTVLAVGVAILVFGFVTGGTSDVLTKAVNLCTECIGLG